MLALVCIGRKPKTRANSTEHGELSVFRRHLLRRKFLFSTTHHFETFDTPLKLSKYTFKSKTLNKQNEYKLSVVFVLLSHLKQNKGLT